MASPSSSSVASPHQANVPMRQAAPKTTSVRRASTKAPKGHVHNVVPTLKDGPKRRNVPAPPPGTVSLPMLRATQASQGRDNACKPISLRGAVKLSELMWRLAEVAQEREGTNLEDTGPPYALLDHVSLESFNNIFLYEPAPPPPGPISVPPLPGDVVKLSTILEYMNVMEELQQVYEKGLRLKPASERRLRSSAPLFAYPTPAATPAFPQQDTFGANTPSKPIGDPAAAEQVHPTQATPKRKRGRPTKQATEEPTPKKAKASPAKRSRANKYQTPAVPTPQDKILLVRPFVTMPSPRRAPNALPSPTPSRGTSQPVSDHHTPTRPAQVYFPRSASATPLATQVNAARELDALGDDIFSTSIQTQAKGSQNPFYLGSPYPSQSAAPRVPGAGPSSSQLPMPAPWLFANPDDFLANLNAEYNWTPSHTTQVTNSTHHYDPVNQTGYNTNSASAIPRSMLPRNQPPVDQTAFVASPQSQASRTLYHQQISQRMQAAVLGATATGAQNAVNLNAGYNAPIPLSNAGPTVNGMHQANFGDAGHYQLANSNLDSMSTSQNLEAIPRSLLPRSQPLANQGAYGQGSVQGNHSQPRASMSDYHHQVSQSMQTAYEVAVLGPPPYRE